MGCFSFFPSKNLGGFGDAGMVVTSDDNLAQKLYQLRVHGSEPKYYHKMVGGNFRIDALQAAVISVKLNYLDDWTQKRQKNARDYLEMIVQTELNKIVTVPQTRDGYYHIFNQFILRVAKRDMLLKHLRENKVGCEIYYPVALSNQECFAYLGYKKGDFPIAEKAADETIAIPIYPELTGKQKKYVIDQIKRFYEKAINN
jgi:dTDP-4-amino-4,6-dideoxygalactose transaminase